MDIIKHPAAAPPSSRSTSDTPMTTATGEPPSPAAVVKPADPKDGPDNLTLNCVIAVFQLFGCFTIMSCNQSWADVAVAAVMFFYSTAVSLLILRYWDKEQNNELAAGSEYRTMVRLSLVIGMMFISLALIKLLLRPDWLDIAAIVGIFLCATAIVLGFICELASEMRSRAACHQEKTSDQVQPKGYIISWS